MLEEDIGAGNKGLHPAIPLEIRNTTRSDRSEDQTPPQDVMLFERAKRLMAKENPADFALFVEMEQDSFASNEHAVYLAAECYSALGQYRTAFR